MLDIILKFGKKKRKYYFCWSMLDIKMKTLAEKETTQKKRQSYFCWSMWDIKKDIGGERDFSSSMLDIEMEIW